MQAPSTQALLTQWTWDPSILIGLLLLVGGYMYAVGPLREKRHLGPPATRSQVTGFVLSVLLLIVALLSPLDDIGDQYLFSAHMIQHLLLATLWPPLILMATPGWLARAILRAPGLSPMVSFLVYPAVAILFFNLDIYLWHVPQLYDATLSNQYVHILEHLSFMGLGIFAWWPVLSPIRSQRLAYPMQVLYLFASAMFMMVLGIVFTFAPSPFYGPYQAAPRLWGISAQTDQEVGGLIMWYPGNLPYGVLLVVAFIRWFDAGGPSESKPRPIQSQRDRIGPPVTG